MNVVLTCDGLHGGGCPHGNIFMAEMRNYRRAREEANLTADWRLRVLVDEDGTRAYLDVCRECRGL